MALQPYNPNVDAMTGAMRFFLEYCRLSSKGPLTVVA